MQLLVRVRCAGQCTQPEIIGCHTRCNGGPVRDNPDPFQVGLGCPFNQDVVGHRTRQRRCDLRRVEVAGNRTCFSSSTIGVIVASGETIGNAPEAIASNMLFGVPSRREGSKATRAWVIKASASWRGMRGARWQCAPGIPGAPGTTYWWSHPKPTCRSRRAGLPPNIIGAPQARVSSTSERFDRRAATGSSASGKARLCLQPAA